MDVSIFLTYKSSEIPFEIDVYTTDTLFSGYTYTFISVTSFNNETKINE